MFLVRTLALGPLAAVLLGGLTGIAAAAPAAGDEYETQSRTINLHGLDLTSPAGQAALRHRIVTAAGAVCGRLDTRDLFAAADYDRCREQAIADASVQVNVLIAKAAAPTIAVADASPSRP